MATTSVPALSSTSNLPAAIQTGVIAGGAGATALIRSSSRAEVDDARIAAVLSSTEGTLWSSCFVCFERGVRCGFGRWCEGEQDMGSISHSKMAKKDEWLSYNEHREKDREWIDSHESGADGNEVRRPGTQSSITAELAY
jgi:hypothetical protein